MHPLEAHLQMRREREAFERLAFGLAALLIWAVVLFLSRAAFAQDVAPAPAGPDPLVQLLVDLIAKIRGGHYGVAVAMGIVGVTQAVRRFGSKIPFLKKPLENPIVLWALPTAGSLAAMVVTSLTAGVPIDVGMIVMAVMEGLTAVGLYVGMKKIAEAKEAGKTAAAAVDTKPEALGELAKTPTVPGIAPLTAAEKAAALERLK